MTFFDDINLIEHVVAKTIQTTQQTAQPADVADWEKAYAAADAGSLGVTPSPTFEDTQWKSSHNSFQRNETIFEQWDDWGVHSFELDIHAGDPPSQWPLADNRAEGDWYVYHNTFDQGTHYEFLTDGLADIQRINEADPNHAPITLFIDLKGDVFQSGQTIEDFDNLLMEQLGESLYMPGEFTGRSGSASTLHEALEQDGWPTVDQLQGKVVVVLTGGSANGQLGEYTGNEIGATSRAAFIAPDADIDTEFATFDADSNAIFYNMRANNTEHADLVTEHDFMLRVWDLNSESSFVNAQDAGANYLGTNKVNTERDDWSTTHSGDSPFTTITAIRP